MSNWVSVVVILGLIVVGVMVIHLVNGQHRNRIATYSFGRSLWEPQNRATRTDTTEPTTPGAHRAATDEQAEVGVEPSAGPSHGLHRLSGLLPGRARRRRKAAG
ncbi:hypothetical protein ACFU76_08885 [Streptomyces sp. NPDC057539]|uniref:hypothetical protein n=1 Tax=Streptomyces sp. NPDC057539 TaxID=3346159 RepID=UPI0036C575D2